MQESPRTASCPTEGRPIIDARRPERTIWIDDLPIADLHSVDAGPGQMLHVVKLYRTAPIDGLRSLIDRVRCGFPSARTGGITISSIMQALDSDELDYGEFSTEEPIWMKILKRV